MLSLLFQHEYSQKDRKGEYASNGFSGGKNIVFMVFFAIRNHSLALGFSYPLRLPDLRDCIK